MSEKRLNDYFPEFIKILEKLSYYTKNKGDVFRSNAYVKAANALQKIETPVKNIEDLKKIPNIGKTIVDKLGEYIDTGKVEALEKEKNDPIIIFTNIYGIGPKRAKELIDKNIKSIEELEKPENKKLLNNKQLIGLKYYKPLLERIPRKEIEEFKLIFNNIFNLSCKQLDFSLENNKFEIVGSYRRGAETSGDIDVIITSNNSIAIYNKFLDNLIVNNILIEMLSRGDKKSLTIGKLPDETSIARRIDFLYTPPNEYAFAILYFTGSKEFNTKMRQHALENNLTLNEHGICKINKKTKMKEEKIDKIFKTEKDIFDYLNLEYKEPHNRKDDTMVIIKSQEQQEPKLQEQQEPESQEQQEPESKPQKEIEMSKTETKQEKKQEEKVETKVEKKQEKKEETKEEKKQAEEVEIKTEEVDGEKEGDVEELEKEKIKIKISKKKINEIKSKVKNSSLKSYTKILDKNVIKNIKHFKDEGILVLDSLSEKELTNMLKKAIDIYYCEIENQEEIDKDELLSDNQYDILREYILKKYPNNKLAQEQHQQCSIKKDKIKLPYTMMSMDKIKPDTKELENYKKKFKGPYVISCKLDGVSALYTTESKSKKMYTRGNGYYGQSIDHFIEYLKLPEYDSENPITIRGELIIEEYKFKEKYSKMYSNSRNFVSALVNNKKLSKDKIEMIKDIDFVAYELIFPNNKKPSEQFNYLKNLNNSSLKILIVENMINISQEQLTNKFLSEKLLEFRGNYKYTIDGIIVSNDDVYIRQDKNPEHSFAFKMIISDQIAEAKVIDVLWTASKDGLLKPRVKIEPVVLGGTTINYATGFNAKFIVDNNIGLGAIIKLERSGDVIPHIKEISVQADKPIMPKEEYVWNESKVDIVIENKEDNMIIKIKTITKFFKDLQVEGLGEGNIKKIIESPLKPDSVEKILAMTKDDFMKVSSFKEKMAEKIYSSIKNQINKSSISIIATASNIFGRGFGEKKIETILKSVPDIIVRDDTLEEKIEIVKKIDGMASKTSKQFVEKIPEFLEFIKRANLMYKLNVETLTKSDKDSASNEEKHILYNKKIAMSGFRDKELEEKLKILGIIIDKSVSKKTNILIIKQEGDVSDKIIKAKDYGVSIITLEKFIKKYLD